MKKRILFALALLIAAALCSSCALTGLLFGLLLFLFTAISSSMFFQEEEEVRTFIEKHLLS